MPGKMISDNRSTVRERARPIPRIPGQARRYLKEEVPLWPVERNHSTPAGAASSPSAAEEPQAFRIDREPSSRPSETSVLTAELLRVERTLEQNAAEGLDRRNLPLAG